MLHVVDIFATVVVKHAFVVSLTNLGTLLFVLWRNPPAMVVGPYIYQTPSELSHMYSTYVSIPFTQERERERGRKKNRGRGRMRERERGREKTERERERERARESMNL